MKMENSIYLTISQRERFRKDQIGSFITFMSLPFKNREMGSENNIYSEKLGFNLLKKRG